MKQSPSTPIMLLLWLSFVAIAAYNWLIVMIAATKYVFSG